MRVDLFLKLLGITKTRMGAKRLCEAGWVQEGGKALSPSQGVREGQVLDLQLPDRPRRLRILALPPGRSLAKKDRPHFAVLEDLKEV